MHVYSHYFTTQSVVVHSEIFAKFTDINYFVLNIVHIRTGVYNVLVLV